MAHFAEVDANNVVLRVIVVANADAPDPAPSNSEPLGRQYLASIGLDGNWVQTSYNGSFRKQYAGPGYTYIPEADVFIRPQPYPSWTLDANYDWQPPTARPEEGRWFWDESTQAWIGL